MKYTGILFFPAFDWSLGETHPEREERLLYTQEQLFEEGILDLPQVKQYSPNVAHIRDVLRTQALFPSPQAHDLNAHLVAAGSSLVLGDAWNRREIKNGFALVRPPGHHSGATVLGNRGFCTLNNEAILVNYLRSKYGIKKVAIIDTDVHHGDGTQDIFYHDPDVLFISIHQDGRTLYPGSGFTDEKGGPNAWSKTINIPLPPGAGDDALLHVLDSWVLPKIQEFGPDLIINSAGQDNHFTDPLASMNVTARGYGKINEIIKPDLAILEGGYSIEGALPYVNLAIFLALAGEDYNGVTEPQKPKRPVVNINSFKSYLKDLKAQNERLKPNWTIKDEPFLPKGKWAYIPRSIYYDTEGFQELRHDRIRLCNHCGGTVMMLSQHVELGEKYALIRIPFEACPDCEQAGLDLWDYLITQFKIVLLQNQTRDQIVFWNKNEGVKII
ncbi:MAG: histone deacetylase [Desulfitobacterium hafniense]|nr:histone deacetylase [Desulfitobacterium hafniense]